MIFDFLAVNLSKEPERRRIDFSVHGFGFSAVFRASAQSANRVLLHLTTQAPKTRARTSGYNAAIWL